MAIGLSMPPRHLLLVISHNWSPIFMSQTEAGEGGEISIVQPLQWDALAPTAMEGSVLQAKARAAPWT